MKLEPTSLPGVVALQPRVFRDDRGWFMESFNRQVFDQALAQAGLPAPGDFVQDNHSLSVRHVLRGLHYQLPPFAQGKVVRVVRGAVWDVVLDLRRSSPTWGQWTACELSEGNRTQLWIPAGFAHGFLALSDTVEFLYKTTAPYDKASERCIRWNDPALGIAWPLPPGQAPLLHDKDQDAPDFAHADYF